jgi:hypothetical protein
MPTMRQCRFWTLDTEHHSLDNSTQCKDVPGGAVSWTVVFEGKDKKQK